MGGVVGNFKQKYTNPARGIPDFCKQNAGLVAGPSFGAKQPARTLSGGDNGQIWNLKSERQ